MAKPEPTPQEVSDKKFTRLCELIVNDSAYEILRTRLYDKITSGDIASKYAPEDRCAVEVGAMKIVPVFFKMIEDSVQQKPEPKRHNRNEY